MDSDGQMTESEHQMAHALDEAQRMVMAQGVTINALQQRIFRLEMEIVDMISASFTQPPFSPPPEPDIEP